MGNGASVTAERRSSRHGMPNRKLLTTGPRKNSQSMGSVSERSSVSKTEAPAIPLASLDFEGPRPPAPPPMVPDPSTTYNLMEEGEDVCPTCLEEYTEDNPRISTACGHPFHLSCILEWQDRNPHCPVCARKMEFVEA